ncbi:MAG: D-2-hydroxyacid dehydrogenase [Dehalococcoidia bacterium]
MGELKIAYGYSIPEEYLKRLEAISSDLRLLNVIDLVKVEYSTAKEHGADSPEARAARAKVDDVIREVEVYYSATLPSNLPERAPNLKWLQYVWDGIDLDVGKDILESPIVITNARQISALNIAEWVVMVMLMFSKRANDLLAERNDRFWSTDFYDQWELREKTVGVVGLGAIGGDVARLCKAFGMRVMATRRSATQRQSNVGDVDEVLPASDLDVLLKESDFVVMSVPGTPETTKLIGERELRLIGPSGYLINVARGSIVDETALVRALKEGWIAGAGLDVFEVEPLPKDSEIWGLHNVIMASHKTGDVMGYDDRIADLLCRNVERYVKGEELINLVNKKAGY